MNLEKKPTAAVWQDRPTDIEQAINLIVCERFTEEGIEFAYRPDALADARGARGRTSSRGRRSGIHL